MPVGDMIPRVIPNLIGYTPPFGAASIPTGTAIFGESSVGAAGKGAVWTPDTSKVVQPDGVGGFDVTAWDDESGTKTLDGTAAPPALSIGALDGHDGVQADGVSEYMTLSGLGFVSGDRPSMFVLAAATDVTDINIGYYSRLDDGGGVFALRIDTDVQDAWQWLTHEFSQLNGYGTPEASNDTGFHLHEAHNDADELRGYLDAAQEFGATGGATNALASPMSRITLGANYAGGAPVLFGPVTVTEVVFGESIADAQRASYRNDRIAPYYPTVGSNFP